MSAISCFRDPGIARRIWNLGDGTLGLLGGFVATDCRKVVTSSRPSGFSGFVGLRSASIRQIFRAAFEQADSRYFHPARILQLEFSLRMAEQVAVSPAVNFGRIGRLSG